MPFSLSTRPTGRPYPKEISHARQMIQSEKQSVSGMAKLLGVHRVTLHKALRRQ